MIPEIKKLKTQQVTLQELERAKTKTLADTLYAQDSQFAQARIYGSLMSIGLTIEDVGRWTQDIEAVSAADILKAANLYLDASQSITGILTPPMDTSNKTKQGSQKADGGRVICSPCKHCHGRQRARHFWMPTV